jgi:hypothetical protein
MVRIDRHPGRLLLTATVLVITSALPLVRAQDEEVEEDVVVGQPFQFVQQFQFNARVYEQQMEHWVFGNQGGAVRARAHLEAILSQLVDEYDRICGLSPAQRKKLEVAGRGDIKRFFDRVDETRRKFREHEGPWDRNRLNAAWQEARPLQQALRQDWFQEQSLFCKALHHTLNEDQVARYEQELHDRAVFLYRAAVGWAAVTLASSMGWNDQQRQRFENVILEETRTPKKSHPQVYFVVLCQAARIPEEKLRPIFDELQWRLLRQELIRARSVERSLRNDGFVPDEGPASAPAGTRPKRRSSDGPRLDVPLRPVTKPELRNSNLLTADDY